MLKMHVNSRIYLQKTEKVPLHLSLWSPSLLNFKPPAFSNLSLTYILISISLVLSQTNSYSWTNLVTNFSVNKYDLSSIPPPFSIVDTQEWIIMQLLKAKLKLILLLLIFLLLFSLLLYFVLAFFIFWNIFHVTILTTFLNSTYWTG